jgi:kumamolisin
MVTTPKNLTDQLKVTLLIRRPTFDGMTVQDHADGIVAGTHQVLDRDQFESMFGASDSDIALVTDFVEQAGLTVDHAHCCSAAVIAGGSVEQINQLFGITLNDIVDADRTYTNYTGTIVLPDSIKDIVTYISGLDTFSKRVFSRSEFAPLLPAPTTGQRTRFSNPQKVATAYNFPGYNNGNDGAGQSIAIVEPFNGTGWTQTNLDTTFRYYQLPTPNIIPVILNDEPFDPDGPGSIEDMLDIATIGGILPKADILVYICGSVLDGFLAVLHDTQHTGYYPKIMSCSFAGAETQDWHQEDALLAEAVTLGVTVCAGSGDWGPYDAEVGYYLRALGPCWPAVNPNVLAVGGITCLLNPDQTLAQEIVYNLGSDYYITGGNQSTVYPVPSYQTGLTLTPLVNSSVGSPTTLTNRATPDVALLADPANGYPFWYSNSNIANYANGTSWATPLFAGLIGRINQTVGHNVGFVNTKFYNNPSAFNDILPSNYWPGYLSQSNEYNGTGFMTTSGWDATTGLGSPKGASVLALFASNTGSISVTGAWSIGPGWTYS